MAVRPLLERMPEKSWSSTVMIFRSTLNPKQFNCNNFLTSIFQAYLNTWVCLYRVPREVTNSAVTAPQYLSDEVKWILSFLPRHRVVVGNLIRISMVLEVCTEMLHPRRRRQSFVRCSSVHRNPRWLDHCKPGWLCGNSEDQHFHSLRIKVPFNDDACSNHERLLAKAKSPWWIYQQICNLATWMQWLTWEVERIRASFLTPLFKKDLKRSWTLRPVFLGQNTSCLSSLTGEWQCKT